ncbi:MAG: hypothetical protein INQ03_04330 [Candidatus Heimdallarchaeota archaeon]|nr:hypothetical protein [Candidatus Heimdallarchaeota archaeon]
MISKEEFIQRLRTQFGVFLNHDEYEKAYERSLVILDEIEPDSNADMFYLFIHALLLDVLKRLDTLEQMI